MNVSDFIHSSKELASVKGYYVSADDFLMAYTKLNDIEKKSLVLHYIMDNSPFAFTNIYQKPILYEQIKQYISHILDVNISHIKLIGSTKTGFRMDTEDYGAVYSKTSDLDFMIIDDRLFSVLQSEFYIWENAYLKEKSIEPKNENEKKYWDYNKTILQRSIGLGFIDTKFMPNRTDLLPTNSKVNNTMSLVVRNLKSQYGFITKGASMRVYNNTNSYYCQQVRNIEAIIKTYKGK